MGGTVEGGILASITVKQRYGPNFYKLIGSIGGRVTGKKGFATNTELAKYAGAVGGMKSRRGKKRTPAQEKLYQQCLANLQRVQEEARARRNVV